MTKKKKVFIIVYIIALLTIITLLINKIIAAENTSDTSEGSVDTGNYVGKKLPEEETYIEITPPNRDKIDFGNTDETKVREWAKGTVSWDLLTTDNDLFCLDKNKRMVNSINYINQYIRKVTSVDLVGHKEGTDFATVSQSDTYYPTDESYVSSTLIPELTYPYAYASLVFNWEELDVRHETQDDFGMAAAYVFVHRNEYTNKPDNIYTDAQYALWAMRDGKATVTIEHTDNNIYDDQHSEESKKLKEEKKKLKQEISELKEEINELKEKIECIKELDTVKDNIRNQNNTIDNIDAEINELYEQLDTLEGGTSAYNNKQAEIDRKLNELDSAIAKLDEYEAQRNQKLEELESYGDAEIDKIVALEYKIIDLENNIQNQNNIIDKIDAKINELYEELNTLQEGTTAYRDKENEINRKIDELDRAIAKLDGYEAQRDQKLEELESYRGLIESDEEILKGKESTLKEKEEKLAEYNNGAIAGDSPANQLLAHALAFEEYREKFEAPSLKDSNGKYEFKYVKNGDYFIAGPVKINYPSLKTAAGEVVGVIDTDNLKLTGKDEAGTVKDIDRTQFDITDKDGNKIENFAKDCTNFEFYIKVNNQAIKNDEIRYIIDFTIKFKYMNITADGYKIYDEDENVLEYYEWTREQNEEESSGSCKAHCQNDNCDYRFTIEDCDHTGGSFDATCPLCGTEAFISHNKTTLKYRLERETTPSSYAELQPTFMCGRARMFWEFYELKITFKPDGPDGGLPTYLDLGGKVWVDNPTDNGKIIDDADGIINNNEWGRENVLVELFFSDGTPVKVKKDEVVEDDRNENLVNPANGEKVSYNNTTYGYAMYTDSEGNYMFYGLPVDQNYYVRFTYDGQTYTITKYLAGGGEEDYKKNPNQAKYDDNSKVKDETNRQEFNNRFETITYTDRMPKWQENSEQEGKASRADQFIKYLNKIYPESGVKYIKSKIITTDNKRDAEYGETGDKKGPDTQTGKAIDPFKMQARTPESLKYPFEKDGEILIYSTASEDTALEGNALHYLQHINLGLKFRQRADFQLSTQLKAGATTIKDKEKVVIYPQSAKKENLDKDMDFTRQEDEYIKQEISAADYNWATQFEKIYGENGQEITGYVVDEDKLHVYVLYRIAIKNQCEDANDYGIINEIIDYYDNRFERVPKSEITRASRLFRDAGLKVPSNDYESWIEDTGREVIWIDKPSKTIKTGDITYNIMTSDTEITVLENNPNSQKNTETAIYLMLKVKDTDSVLGDKTIKNGKLYTGGEEDEQTGMQNIAEIGSYTVKNGNDVVGKIDKDSAPGNATPGKNETYEDDTDASPMFKLVINWTPKEIKGTVWDDSDKDGIMNEPKSNGIENVTVKLVEYIVEKDAYGHYIVTDEIERPGIELGYNTIKVDPNQCVKTSQKGEYSFYVEGGNYSLKFIYGNKEMLYEVNANGTTNKNENKKYNGQDYQATDYTPLSSGVPGYVTTNNKLKAFATNSDLEKAYENFLVVGQVDADPADDLSWWNTNWNISGIFGKQSTVETKEWGLNSKYNRSSNARDKATIRANIIENTQKLTYSNASVLDKLNSENTLSIDDAEFLSGGNTVKELYRNNENYTYMESVSDIITIASNDLITEPNVINFGLKERPVASRQLEKRVDRIILTASDGTILVDTGDNTKQSGLQKLDGIQQTFINLEPRVMDGAKLDIYYTLTVTNDSVDEDGNYINDCLDNYVYVRGDVTDGELQNNDNAELKKILGTVGVSDLTSELPIRATIFDYVNINLEYRADDNKNEAGEAIWTKVYEENGDSENTVKEIKDGWLSDDAIARIQRDQKKVSKVVQTETSKLLAGESVEIPIHLGITLSEDTSGKNLNDFDFSNCAEITQITTSAGRRDYYTVPGDYVPYNTDENNKKQADASLTGTTAITPPLGEGRFYYVITIVSASIILAGIILIKKKVLKK